MKKMFFPFLLMLTACSKDQAPPATDCTKSDLSVQLVESQGSDCQEATGSFTVMASGGVSPYLFASADMESADGTFTGVSAGVHQVTVEDEDGCSVTLEVSIPNLTGVNIEDVSSAISGCGSSDGSITVTAADGQEPYQFSLDGGPFQPENTFSNLSRGTYELTVRDQEGCETFQRVEVLSGISFAQSIKPIIDSNCAVSDCHNGSQSPDLRSFSSIKSNASTIKRLTGNGTMPKEGSLSQSQVDMIACWVDDGALNN